MVTNFFGAHIRKAILHWAAFEWAITLFDKYCIIILQFDPLMRTFVAVLSCTARNFCIEVGSHAPT